VGDSGNNKSYNFFVLFFVLAIIFCLVSAGIFKANTSISMVAYATKSEGSSGGGKSSDGGGGSKSDDGSSSSDRGSSDEGGGGSSGGSNDNGGGDTGGDNSLKTEEPSTPPPPTCEQGSTSPECSNVPEPPPPPPPPPGPIDCSTTPNDPSCKTTPGAVDCNTNPNDLSCGPQPPVDCKTNPDNPSCTQPPPAVDCKANPNDPSCKPDCTKNPDDPYCKQPPCDPNTESCPPPPVDCTKNPEDPSCKVDCTTNPDDPSCPPTPPCQPAVIGISCPPPPPPPSCPSGEHYDPNQKKCIPDKPPCPAVKVLSEGGSSDDCKPCPGIEGGAAKMCPPPPPCKTGEHRDPSTNKCVPDNCPKNQHYDSKLNKCVPNPPCKKDERYDAVQNKCVPICPDGTELLNGKCPTKTLSLSISVDKDPIIRGHEQTITVTVLDKDTHQKVNGANVKVTVHYASGFQHTCPDKSTDGSGKAECKWTISGNAKPGTFKVTVTATKDGYKSASGTKSFTVKPATPSVGGGGGGHNQGTTSPPAIQQIKYFREFTDMPSNSPIYITSTSMHKDILNDIIITGEIKNRGTNTANFVELIATFYNINNQTVGNENTFTKPSTLQPGQAAPFTMYLNPKDMPLSQIKSVKYHLSWKYAVSSPLPSSPASKTLVPNRSS
jgi:hypothetical protein